MIEIIEIGCKSNDYFVILQLRNCLLFTLLLMTKELTEYLKEFMLPERYNQMLKVLGERTEYILPVVENLNQSHNANAVIRTCECLGFQRLTVIENYHEFLINREVCMGSTKWIDIERFNSRDDNTEECITALKERGYRIVATSPHPTKGVSLEDFDLEKGKCAFLFGSEKPGLTKKALSMADEFVTIPMYGFTESFNISVSCALILYNLRQRLNASNIDYHLSEQQHYEILLDWMRKSIRECDKIIARRESASR